MGWVYYLVVVEDIVDVAVMVGLGREVGVCGPVAINNELRCIVSIVTSRNVRVSSTALCMD